MQLKMYKVFNVSPGITSFNLYNIPITFEIFIFTKFTWLSQDNVSVRVVPRKLNESIHTLDVHYINYKVCIIDMFLLSVEYH